MKTIQFRIFLFIMSLMFFITCVSFTQDKKDTNKSKESDVGITLSQTQANLKSNSTSKNFGILAYRLLFIHLKPSLLLAPVGATVTVLPSDYTMVVVSSTTYYYYGGIFYIISGGSYNVVEAPVGAVVSNLPEGAEEVEVDGVKLLKYNGAFFQPVSQNGDDAYEVVTVKNNLIKDLIVELRH